MKLGKLIMEKGKKLQNGWFHEITLIVLTSICTMLATQVVYKHNIALQIKMEVEKDLVLKQYHIYNKVKSLKEHYQIITYKGKFNVRENKTTVYMDPFKNEIDKKNTLSSFVKQDTMTIVSLRHLYFKMPFTIYLLKI